MQSHFSKMDLRDATVHNLLGLAVFHTLRNSSLKRIDYPVRGLDRRACVARLVAWPGHGACRFVEA